MLAGGIVLRHVSSAQIRDCTPLLSFSTSMAPCTRSSRSCPSFATVEKNLPVEMKDILGGDPSVRRKIARLSRTKGSYEGAIMAAKPLLRSLAESLVPYRIHSLSALTNQIEQAKLNLYQAEQEEKIALKETETAKKLIGKFLREINNAWMTPSRQGALLWSTKRYAAWMIKKRSGLLALAQGRAHATARNEELACLLDAMQKYERARAALFFAMQ